MKEECSDAIPLDWACCHGHMDIIELLLERGAKIHDRNKWGNTCLMTAARNGRVNVVELLLSRGAKNNEVLLNHGVNVNNKDNEGWFSLHVAAAKGQKDVKLLLDRGADVNDIDHEGWNSIIKAASRGHDKIVKMLPSFGANAYKMEYASGNTAIKYAKLKNHDNIVNSIERWPVTI